MNKQKKFTRKELRKKFGINKTKTLRDYVLWLNTKRADKFVTENADRTPREMGNHWTCMQFKVKIITDYAIQVVTD